MSEEEDRMNESRLKWADKNAAMRKKMNYRIKCTEAQADRIFDMELAINDYLLKIYEENK